jgi:hypothetical protein
MIYPNIACHIDETSLTTVDKIHHLQSKWKREFLFIQ